MHSFFPSSMSILPYAVQGSRVAIITRTKNRPVLLARALSSILHQTYEDWHLYLVNDGGDAEAVEILAESYAPLFKGRITIFHHKESLGMEAASNSALSKTISDFVVIHDDDDSWKPTFLEETTTFLNNDQNAGYAAVAVNCIVVFERIVKDRVLKEEEVPWKYWQERVDLQNMLVKNNIPPISLLIRKRVVDHIGPYNSQLPVLGDWDYNLRIMMLGDIGTINSPLAYYHHRRNSEYQSQYGNSIIDGIKIHLDYQVLYRNSMIRQLISKEPEYVGLLHVLLSRIDQLENRLVEQNAHIQNNILENVCSNNHKKRINVNKFIRKQIKSIKKRYEKIVRHTT